MSESNRRRRRPQPAAIGGLALLISLTVSACAAGSSGVRADFFAGKAGLDQAAEPERYHRASALGRYEGLIGVLPAPADLQRYGEWHDYGYWKGGSYNGVENLPPGYWVYLAPDWYLWDRQAPAPPAASAPPVAAPAQTPAAPQPAPDVAPLDCPQRATDPAAIFRALGLRTDYLGKPVDHARRGYLETRRLDGSVDDEMLAAYRAFNRKRSYGVMNPGSRGASVLIQALADSYVCLGIDTPGKGAWPRSQEARNLIDVVRYQAEVQGFFSPISPNGYPEYDAGLFAPIFETRDGGAFLVAQRPAEKTAGGSSMPYAVKFDASGQVVWKRRLASATEPHRGFEVHSAHELPDGATATLISVHPSHAGRPRLTVLEPDGRVRGRWEGQVRRGSPTELRVTKKGTVAMKGHSYSPGGKKPLLEWTAELAPTGKLLWQKTGGPFDPILR